AAGCCGLGVCSGPCCERINCDKSQTLLTSQTMTGFALGRGFFTASTLEITGAHEQAPPCGAMHVGVRVD
nr:hypothetical protein [Rhodoferax sp.]